MRRQLIAQLLSDCMDKMCITNKSILPRCIHVFGSIIDYIGST
jgi:hypothetical protein